MFDNIGGKIKGLATAVTVIGIISSIICGIFLLAEEEALLGIVVGAAGSFVSWISSFVLYGFGQLVENSDIIARYITYDKSDEAERIKEFTNFDNQYPGYRYDESATQSNNFEEEINETFKESDYVDFRCPHCRETLSFTQENIKIHKTLTCPMCEKEIDAKSLLNKF